MSRISPFDPYPYPYPQDLGDFERNSYLRREFKKILPKELKKYLNTYKVKVILKKIDDEELAYFDFKRNAVILSEEFVEWSLENKKEGAIIGLMLYALAYFSLYLASGKKIFPLNKVWITASDLLEILCNERANDISVLAFLNSPKNSVQNDFLVSKREEMIKNFFEWRKRKQEEEDECKKRGIF